MAGKTFSVNNAAAAAITFNPTTNLKDGVNYVDSTTALSAPRLAVVKHTLAPSTKSAGIDRHYVEFSQTRYDANGLAFTARVGVSLVVPRTVTTTADVADLVAFSKNFLADTAKMASLQLGDY